jgi:hypothetical protein
MAPSQPIAGVEIQAGGDEKAEAKGDKDDIEHWRKPQSKVSGKESDQFRKISA